MKANRKFIEGDERAVSAVIGVILMVAITVAIAATVYVYVSGMLGGGLNKTPDIAFTKSSDKITVSRADSKADWNDSEVTITGVTGVRLNGAAPNLATGGAVTTTNNDYVLAGDYINVTGTGSISLRHTPTNSLIGHLDLDINKLRYKIINIFFFIIFFFPSSRYFFKEKKVIIAI